MYGTLLSILKVISEGLTAGFGVFGLMTEFKDREKKITRAGRIALIGIVATFIVSGVIAVLENANARAEERAHAAEVKRLSRPLTKFEVSAFFVRISNSDLSPEEDKFWSWVQTYTDRTHEFPTRTDIPSGVHNPDIGYPYMFSSVKLFKRSGICRKDWVPMSPDLEIADYVSTPVSTPGLWRYEVSSVMYIADEKGNNYVMEFQFPRNEEDLTGSISSVEDLPGSTLWIQFDFARLTYIRLDRLRFTFSPGVHFDIAPSQLTEMAGYHEYCFEIPKLARERF